MNKPNKKKMAYALDVTRRVKTTELIRDGGTEKEAKALKGTWIKLNREMFAFVEDAETTIVEITKDTIGCGCERFTDVKLPLVGGPLMCKHLIARANLKTPTQLMIDSDEKICRVLTEYLFSLGWYSDKDRWLYPSLDSPTRLDPVHEEKELDLGVDDAGISGDEKQVQKASSNVDKREFVHYKCPKCGEEVDVEKDKLTDWKLNHMEICKGKKQGHVKGVPDPSPTDDATTKQRADEMMKATSDPEGESNEGDDPTPNKPPKKTPVPKPGMMSTKCAWCGEKIERELAVDLARALDDHHKICPKRPKEQDVSKTGTTEKGNIESPNPPPIHESWTLTGECPLCGEKIERECMADLVRAMTEHECPEPRKPEPPFPGATTSIAKAMCKVQQTELFAILNADNPFVKSKYADLSSVWAAIRKPITDNGMAVIQTTEPYEGGITVVTTLMHISGETLTTRLSTKVPEKMPDKNGQEQSNIQTLGSSITYLRRYSLAAMIGVCPTDDDGESAMGREKR